MLEYKESITLNPHLKADLYEHTDNGLKVILAENHSHPIVGYERVVLAGSANDKPPRKRALHTF